MSRPLHSMENAESRRLHFETSINVQALADFLVDYPIPADWEISEDFPDEEVFFVEAFQLWMMFFDGSALSDGVGDRVVSVSPQRQVLPYAFILGKKSSNNVAEYQALIIGLQMALELGFPSLAVSGDSKLVINQLLKEYEVNKEDLIPYFCYATNLISEIDSAELEHIKLISRFVNNGYCLNCLTAELKRLMLFGSESLKLNIGGNLSSITSSMEGEDEAAQAMDEAHLGVCSAHQSSPKLHFRIKRMGYYWLTIVKDCLDYAKRCQACQFHANFIHQPPEPLGSTIASLPFDAWGLDVVGHLPKSSGGHLYILTVIDGQKRFHLKK
ncbi:hypothetical protein RJ639_018595 [Escallonia herrerae]|uniref:Uncharacterized protein n=1 Tax=Escallonia herrerae TaxID=1293975 RepID=A0AA88V794_9ASTE|nr:hypothetical protein RJ639_018595 [Escallonia herrerae]